MGDVTLNNALPRRTNGIRQHLKIGRRLTAIINLEEIINHFIVEAIRRQQDECYDRDNTVIASLNNEKNKTLDERIDVVRNWLTYY